MDGGWRLAVLFGLVQSVVVLLLLVRQGSGSGCVGRGVGLFPVVDLACGRVVVCGVVIVGLGELADAVR